MAFPAKEFEFAGWNIGADVDGAVAWAAGADLLSTTAFPAKLFAEAGLNMGSFAVTLLAVAVLIALLTEATSFLGWPNAWFDATANLTGATFALVSSVAFWDD